VDPAEGPVGTVVEITGRGFTEGEDLDGTEVTINFDSPAESVGCYIITEDTVDNDGEFKIEVVIPQTDDISEDYYLVVLEDDGTNDAEAEEDFEVTGLAEIELDPEYGVQGSTVSIEGWNFTQISGKDIEIWLCTEDDPDDELALISDSLETESNGEISGWFTVPAKSSDVYTIKAEQVDYNIYATANFQIGLMIVIPTPKSGPTGTEVTLTGTGFTTGNNWNATFGDLILVADDDGDIVDTDLELDGGIPTFYVPTIDPGTYTISVYDIFSEITVNVDWTVTATTMVEFDPVSAPNEYNVSITGRYFNADSDEVDVDLDFVLYNVTADGETDEEWDLDVLMRKPGTTAELDEDGNFTAWWEVLDDEELSLGSFHGSREIDYCRTT
jgi:hypothetical protein